MQHWETLLPWIAVSLVIWLSVILLRRQVYRDFPFFFSYLIYSILATAARLWVSNNYRTFFIVYWITEAIYAAAALLALHEVFRRIFAAFYLFWWFRLLFPAAVALIALMTSTALSPPAAAPEPLRFILLSSLVAKYIEAWLFAVFFGLVLLLGLTWRTYAFGIVQGFAVSALGTWIASTGRSEFGIKFRYLEKYGPPVAYILAVAVWLMMFWRPEAPAATEEWTRIVNPNELAAELKESTDLLWRFIRKK